jgi:hypothetical protein
MLAADSELGMNRVKVITNTKGKMSVLIKSIDLGLTGVGGLLGADSFWLISSQ